LTEPAPPDAQEIAAFLRDMDRDGFAVVPRIVDADAAAALRGALEAAITKYPYRDFAGGRDVGMVHALMLWGRPFETLLSNARLRGLLSAVLGETCVLYAYTSSSMPPNGANYSARIHVDCPRFIPGYVTNVGVTLMLDDFTEESGATYLLPGSHRRPDAPAEDVFFRDAVRAIGRTGDAILFNGRTWHRGGENRTQSWRHAATLNACRAYMKQQLDWVRLVPPEIVDRNPPSFRQFLGYDVRVPAGLDEFYVPEEARLYKANQG
jgi:ectoine hydroxylase-related dioxygenase (phytanoyl-CoA dioxygenase family)